MYGTALTGERQDLMRKIMFYFEVAALLKIIRITWKSIF